MALGIPGDSVMAVMIGSMIVWGIQPGPSLFVNQPELVVTITAIMVLATIITLAINLVRMPMMVKLLDMPKHYIWATVLVFCIVGTYATTNNLFTVTVMLIFGVIGVMLKRADPRPARRIQPAPLAADRWPFRADQQTNLGNPDYSGDHRRRNCPERSVDGAPQGKAGSGRSDLTSRK
jgi:chromate transport protein ChrA